MNISALQATGKQRGLGLEPQEEILADFSLMAVATTALTSSQTLLSAFKRTQHPPAGSLNIINLNEVHL